ncbi:EAL domain-containing response regulator [Thiomicrorhabdus sp.]|uniref:EAL domain-containing response regulator n=1 Tax=Thiomicrorhabdus sp. TaxID=2039724 RepID=UPI002AA84F5C|nr:EAL domain-containing response regulator [Thiomicrorhabdus sp.]
MTAQVFILDDEISYGELIAEVAEMQDLVAVYTDNPMDFEVTFNKHPMIKILFLDLNMPKLDGIEILRILAEKNFSGNVVLMSGFDAAVLETARVLADESGLNLLDPISKPFSLQKVAEILSNQDFDSLNLNENVVSLSEPKSQLLSRKEVLDALQEGRYEVHFQPQICMLKGELNGVESLVRLLDKDGGLIYPDRFIQVAEKYHMTKLLLSCVLSGVVEAYINHLRFLGDFTISINVSALDLDDLNFPDNLNNLVQNSLLSPSKIIVEVTESKAILQIKTGLDILARLRLKGFQLSIDDFGTGSAVLSNIKKMPFNELKIDKSFVDRLLVDYRTRSITQDLISMGHNLGLKIVAEGIEDRETELILKGMGCDIAQGYLHGKPMPAADLVEWFKKRIPHK